MHHETSRRGASTQKKIAKKAGKIKRNRGKRAFSKVSTRELIALERHVHAARSYLVRGAVKQSGAQRPRMSVNGRHARSAASSPTKVVVSKVDEDAKGVASNRLAIPAETSQGNMLLDSPLLLPGLMVL